MFKNEARRCSEAIHPLVERVLSSKTPVAELIGFDVKEIGHGHAVALLEAGTQHFNPMGTLHGGVICSMADAAMGMAFASTLAQAESFTTMAISVSFFRPVWQTELRAKARVTNRGKNVGYIECEVNDKDGRLVAKATSSCLVLRGDSLTKR